jgi:hypothetical protein
MRSYFHPIPKPPAPSPTVRVPEPQEEIPEDPYPDLVGIGETFKGYYSDNETSSNESDEWSEDETEPKEKEPNNSEAAPPQAQGADPKAHFHVHQSPPLKQRKLAVPTRAACQNAKDVHRKELEIGLKQIEKLIRSKHEVFAAGKNSLQAYRARSIQSYLHMVVHNGRKRIDVPERAAESQGFATTWGGHLVWQWAQIWIKSHRLLMSCRGQHMKAFTLLSDPVICAELRAFVRSHKWAI